MRKPAVFLPKKKDIAFFGALAAAMAFANCALPRHEPAAFALLFAAAMCRQNPFACAAAYLAASTVFLSPMATLTCALQAVAVLLAAVCYKRFAKTPGAERALLALLAQIPFVFLFPYAGYGFISLHTYAQKAIVGLFLAVFSLLAEGAVRALLWRVFRCRLSAGELAELALLWLIVGTGIVRAAGEEVFFALTLFPLLVAAALFANAAAVPFAIALALPLCAVQVSAEPVAAYAAFSCAALLLAPYGRVASALALALCFLAECWFAGLFYADALSVALGLSACALPAVASCCLPEKLMRRLKHSLLFYRERVLPRIAVNRSRRAVGEQLYEVSALFREIECAFRAQEKSDDAGERICGRLETAVCKACSAHGQCEKAGMHNALLRLVRVGCAKGKANLIDLPADLGNACKNVAGMLFALNKELAEYRGYLAETAAAREGRRLLAEQARGVSEILKEIALEQSEEYAFSDEETVLARALQECGMLSSEIFLYGEGAALTVSMTLESGTDARKLCRVAGEALGVPLALAEKIPLTRERACFVLRRRPAFDAAFGIAARPKAGEQTSGDTHSILKIDERRFLVALSDGMGSGEPARDVSARTLSLLESFYKAKMPSETVLATVNRLIAFSADETFSCLDLAAVDLDTGGADIVKIGSPAGFLLSGDELKILEGESLPIGMLEAVHPATMRVTLKADDFLVFMSDGIAAAFGSSADLCAYLNGLHPLNPQALAENVLAEAAARLKAGGADDDMTVLAVKLTAA